MTDAQVQGEGFTAKVQNGKLLIEVDLNREGVPSRSGKTMVIASSRGNLNIGDVTLGLNVYRKRQRGQF